MHELVAAAIEHHDFQRAAQLLKQWKKASPKDPVMMLYVAKLQEVTLQLDAAEKTYIQFLKYVSTPKLMGQAREGLKRVQQTRNAARQQDLAAATSVLDSDEPGLLLLEPPADRSAAAQGLAKVLQLDPYTAQMQLPSRGLRMQRIGPIGELQYYGKSLRQVGVPTCWAKVDEVKGVQTFQVQYFRQLQPQPVVICRNITGQLGSIEFDWSEVGQQVRSQLPIFEQVADLGPWGKPIRKEQTQDYAQVIDLQLPGRQIMVRICDRNYDFAKSMDFTHQSHPAGNKLKTTTRIQWNSLLQHLNQHVEGPVHSEFTSFGQGALEFVDLLPYINPNLEMDRRAPTNWDQAFHLYSCMLFLKLGEGVRG